MLAERLSEASARDVSRETAQQVETYAGLLIEENERQNLISKASEMDLLQRHILDGAQLLRHDKRENAHWFDIGTGPGLPGIVIALLHPGPVTLVEPRPLRTAFLEQMIDHFDLSDRVTVEQCKAAHVESVADVITGRAVAPLDRFLNLSHHLSTRKTRWVLPKGRKAGEELEAARQKWQIECRLEQSLTDPEANILIIERARRRGRG